MAFGIKNRRKIIDGITDLDNFMIGSMRGGWYPDGTGPTLGKLADADPGSAAALKAISGPVYVVYSYGTPIAWHVACGRNDWTVPDVRYSVTTSHHLSLTRQAITFRGERIAKVLAELHL